MKLRKNQKPDWYWVTGLHDALLLSVGQEDACLELALDTEGALFDT